MTDYAFSTHLCHEHQMKNTRPILSFDPARDYTAWRTELAAKLRQLVGDETERVEPDIRIEYDRQEPGFREIRFIFTSEPGADVPCHLLIPDGAKQPVPVVICLQGHSPGMHISLGRGSSEAEQKDIAGGRDFALQAVGQGYAALAMEQRCFGERRDARPADMIHHPSRNCNHASMVALLLGRSMVGERVWDVSRAIDALAAFPEVDTTRVACMGNSGGGTITYYAACLEPRIGAAMPSCSFCTYVGSIGSIDHCVDNYIPGALKHFEMADLAALIAPRPLIIVAGRTDNIFPIDCVEQAADKARMIYNAAGVPDNVRLVVGDAGHQFYPDPAWPVFNELTGWKA